MKYYLRTSNAGDFKTDWVQIRPDGEFGRWQPKSKASKLTKKQAEYLINKHWGSGGMEMEKILEYDNIEYVASKRQIRIKDKLL